VAGQGGAGGLPGAGEACSRGTSSHQAQGKIKYVILFCARDLQVVNHFMSVRITYAALFISTALFLRVWFPNYFILFFRICVNPASQI